MSSYEIKPNHYYKENNAADFYIEITDGPFVGLCFVFGQIEFAGETEKGEGIVNFDYNLLYIPANISYEEQKFDIEQLVSSVLHRILETMVENSNNETGTDSIESTDEGRGLPSESDSLPEG